MTNLTENDQKELYDRYSQNDLEAFRRFCIQTIERAHNPDSIMISKMKRMSKKQLLFSTNNFIMSGLGFKVIS